MEKTALQELIQKLISYGEDPDEMKYWLEVYDDLSATAQIELDLNLANELNRLSSS